jgi:hypothetical protein
MPAAEPEKYVFDAAAFVRNRQTFAEEVLFLVIKMSGGRMCDNVKYQSKTPIT